MELTVLLCKHYRQAHDQSRDAREMEIRMRTNTCPEIGSDVIGNSMELKVVLCKHYRQAPACSSGTRTYDEVHLWHLV